MANVPHPVSCPIARWALSLAALASIFGPASAAADQIGVDDRRISSIGGLGYPIYDALPSPRIAYDAADHQFLAVWSADDPDTSCSANDEFEIFGQRLDAATGNEIGSIDFLISTMGGCGDPNDDAMTPAVAYNSVDGEYLVVWAGTEDDSGTVQGEWEIYVQRLDAATGAALGFELRISAMGGIGAQGFPAESPAVAYDPDRDQYLVAWSASDNREGMVEGEDEIFVQRLEGATAAEIGTDDQRISEMGGLGDPAFDAEHPAAVYNSVTQEFLVVWEGDEAGPFQADDEFEIFVQRLDAATGVEVGFDDWRVSGMGPNLDPSYDAGKPAVAYDPVVSNHYLVVWEGDDNIPPLVDGETEIWGQLLDDAGHLYGGQLQMSDMGAPGDPSFDATDPQVTIGSVDHEFLVVWSADDDTLPLVDGEMEIYLQRVDGYGIAHGFDDERLSAMGSNGDPAYKATHPGLAFNPRHDEAMVVWIADDDTPPLVDEEYEVYTQRWIQPLLFADGFESGGTSRWSTVVP